MLTFLKKMVLVMALYIPSIHWSTGVCVSLHLFYYPLYNQKGDYKSVQNGQFQTRLEPHEHTQTSYK